MKIVVFILISCMVSIKTMAQIEMFDESIKKIEEPMIQVYDSLTNMKPQRYGTDEYNKTLHHLIGQVLMYCGDPYSSNGNKGGFEKGAYYRVVAILPDAGGRKYRMLLKNVKTGEIKEENTAQYNSPVKYNYNYTWVVTGYYEKIKSLYLNKKFYFFEKDIYRRDEDKMINLETDSITNNIPENTVWTCVGVQVKPRKKDDFLKSWDYRSPIVLVFDNPSYGKHYCYLENSSLGAFGSLLDKSEHEPYRLHLKSDYDKMVSINAANKAKRKAELTKRFGASNAALIIEGKVRIGMTKAMCEESWGTPDDINKSVGSWGTHEQWVYGNSYLYFEDGKLTAIQN